MLNYYRYFCKKMHSKKLALFIAKILYFFLKIIPFLLSKPQKSIIDYNYKKLNYNNGRLGKLNYKYLTVKCELSIIIPCFNSEKFISRCIESCLNQKTKYSYEIIIINDGSTDNTLNIINNYSDYDQIKILSIKNSKQGFSRNRGIEISEGKIITFVDSDDIIPDFFVQKIIDEMDDNDLLHFGFTYINENDIEIKKNIFKAKPFNYYLNNPRDNFYFYSDGLVCNKAYRRNLFKDIGFPEFIYFEDTFVEMYIMDKVKKYKYVPYPLYKYRLHDDQETSQVKRGDVGINQLEITKMLYFLLKNSMTNRRLLVYLTLSNLSDILYARTKEIDINIQFSLFSDICKFVNKEFDKNDLKYLRFKEKKLLKCFFSRNFNQYIRVQSKL